MPEKIPLVLKHGHPHAMGDTVLFTAIVRDLHAAYPGKYVTEVVTNFTNVWWNNPHVVKLSASQRSLARIVTMDWGKAIKQHAIDEKGNKRHILSWYHHNFEEKTGIKVPVTKPKADLYLSDDEKPRRLAGRYWVVVSGGKLDATVKHWHAHRMQEVVDRLKAEGINCVQVGATQTNHVHPPLERTLNLIGQTDNVRDLWNIILHSDGVICGITGAMHIAAAFDKPCVVYAGGREDPWFEAYTNEYKAFGPEAAAVSVPHRYLHTMGKLPCCETYGCWRNRVVPLDPTDRNRKVHLLCQNPVKPIETHPVAGCQDLISAADVVSAVLSYYSAGTIPAIDKSSVVSRSIQVPVVELVEYKESTVQLIREPSRPEVTQKPHQMSHPLELKANQTGRITKTIQGIDDPVIGGKVTIFVLCYGPYTSLATRCIDGILRTVPADKLDLRVATNQVPKSTLNYLKTTPATKIYEHNANDFKYPVMRQMFYDESHPIKTEYMVWFDDDTWIVNPAWLSDLCTTIVANHKNGFRLYGNMMFHDLGIYANAGYRPDSWFKAATWHKGKPLRSKTGGEDASNGSVIDFAVGWCWALHTQTMQQADIPDCRLLHNGGDIAIGEQLHQAGYGIKQWNKNKSLIACPSREQGGRRGASQRFPWDPKFEMSQIRR